MRLSVVLSFEDDNDPRWKTCDWTSGRMTVLFGTAFHIFALRSETVSWRSPTLFGPPPSRAHCVNDEQPTIRRDRSY